MRFAKHSHLAGRHATLAPSNSSWIRYDVDKLEKNFRISQAVAKGTRLHEIAKQLIEDRINLPDNTETLNLYVNDAIGFRMEPEQVLFYSDNCFGTSDALSFRDNLLRIHDLKTGIHDGDFEQLEAYAALFCLEYHHKPFDIDIELRIYQHDSVVLYDVSRDDLADKVTHIMEQIKVLDKCLNRWRMEAE